MFKCQSFMTLILAVCAWLRPFLACIPVSLVDRSLARVSLWSEKGVGMTPREGCTLCWWGIAVPLTSNDCQMLSAGTRLLRTLREFGLISSAQMQSLSVEAHTELANWQLPSEPYAEG